MDKGFKKHRQMLFEGTSNGEIAPQMCGCKSKKMGTSYWWLSSPNNYNGSNANEWSVNGSNGNLNNNNVTNSNAFRPRFLLYRIFNNIYYTEY